MSLLRLRLRLPDSKQVNVSLTGPVSIETLLQAIQPHVNADPAQISLRIAYPPKELDLGSPDTWGRDVSEIGLKTGESLIVGIKEKTTVQDTNTQPAHAVSAPTQPEPTPMLPMQREKKDSKFDSLFSQETSDWVAPPKERPRGGPSVAEQPPEIPVEGGSIILRVMEDDNSCLFNALIYCVGKGGFQARDLRQIVARKIRDDPLRFDSATLGKTVDEYCTWITRDKSWGGEIELAILSEYFGVGVDCVDVKTGHVFSYGEAYPTHCILIYSGIHYDSLAFSYASEVPDLDVTVFQIIPASEPDYAAILKAAKQMTQDLKKRGYNVDTATFNIVCEQCCKGFVGEKEAIKHANETGHTAFGQIPAEED